MGAMDGQVALVTGAGRERGLGAALARAMAGEGAEVWLTARRAEDAEARAAGAPGARALGLDVTDPASVEAARAAVGRLDVLVHNAAETSAQGETVEAADLAAARRSLEVTLLGAWALTRALLPALRAARGGRVVFVSSGAGSHGDPAFGIGAGSPMGASYSVAKAALGALAHRLAVEEPGLRVNAVCPGFTATFEGGEAMGARPPEESARGVLWAATLPADGPTGGFFRDGAPLPW